MDASAVVLGLLSNSFAEHALVLKESTQKAKDFISN
jgi:hypothetical protein